MTRSEAEERILKALEEIYQVYFDYNPKGEYLNLYITRNFIGADNAFHFGGKDHDSPLSIKVRKEESK